MALVSVIVPVYNVEKYLHRCLESIRNQTLVDIQIIIVDDGSTDGSGKICDDFAHIDNRIICVHKENGGLSDARNTGLDLINSSFIAFIDSDDWIDERMLETLYLACVHNNAEVACCGRYYEYENFTYAKYNISSPKVLTKEDAIKHMLIGDIMDIASWDKVYRKELFTDIYFPVGQIHEDMAIIFDVFMKINKCVHVGSPLYHYFQRESSITKQVFSSKTLVIRDNLLHVRNLLAGNRSLVQYVDAYYYRMIKNMCTVFLSSSQRSGLESKFFELKLDLKTNLWTIFLNQKLKFKDKISILFVITPFYITFKKGYLRFRRFVSQ